MRWNTKEVDTYDCRVMSWYIEAATCSKDMIILFDVSGSMTGFKNYVARRTLRSLLDTLSNNDYVNVYTFKNTTNFVVDCFVDLVQATPENKETLTDTLEPTDEGKTHKVPLEGFANLTMAYIKAFTALKAVSGTFTIRFVRLPSAATSSRDITSYTTLVNILNNDCRLSLFDHQIIINSAFSHVGII